MNPWHDTDFYTGPDRTSVSMALLSVIVVGLLGLPSLLVLALARLRAALAHAAEAKEAEARSDARVLRPGKTVVHGTVVGEGTEPVVTVRIAQNGREYVVSGRTRHEWTETYRQVQAKPFTLRLAGGAQVHVEPGEGVFLVDALGTEERAGSHRRTRVAELRPGEEVFIEGVLFPSGQPASAYRSGSDATFVLRPVNGQLLLVSTEPLEQRHESKAVLQKTWAWALLIVLAVVHAGLFGTYWAARSSGEVVAMPVERLETWGTHDKYGTTNHHFGVVVADGAHAEVSQAAYQEVVTMGAGKATVPFLVASGGVARFVGLEPTLGVAPAVAAWLLLLVVGLLYFATVRGRRAWYEQDRVINGGEGPLGSDAPA